jgi:hypothetical protein
MFILTLFIMDKLWKLPKFPSRDEWITKTWFIDIMEYYSVLRKKKFIWDNMSGI